MGSAGAAKLSPIAQQATRDPAARALALALRTRLYKLRTAPPELQVTDPHKWWNLIATCGPNNRASEETWNRLFPALAEMLIFAPRGPAELRADQPHIIPADPTSMRGSSNRHLTGF